MCNYVAYTDMYASYCLFVCETWYGLIDFQISMYGAEFECCPYIVYGWGQPFSFRRGICNGQSCVCMHHIIVQCAL